MGIVTEAELAQLASFPGVDLAPHSWSHAVLSTLQADQLDTELSRPMEWLRRQCGRVAPWLAYPYGVASDAVRRRAGELGYEGGLNITGGWLKSPRPDRFSLPRLAVPAGLSVSGFRLRLAGFGA
jgi:peptidoglycan/xylan/chitin deacetylase (PgdA/CDA1 family)